MRVLLLSPTRDLDPRSGDTIYTELLVGDPPEGVDYVSYGDAVARGELQMLRPRGGVPELVLDGDFAEAARLLLAGGGVVLRRLGVMYRETPLWFRLRPGSFDLVHMHVFSGRFLDPHPPIVVSYAIPLRFLYRDAFRWPGWRVTLADGLERVLARCTGSNFNGLWAPQATRAIGFTRLQCREFLRHGAMPGTVDQIPNFVPASPQRGRVRAGENRTLLFVAQDFESKGGPQVLAAFFAGPRAATRGAAARRWLATGRRPRGGSGSHVARVGGA